MKIKLQNCKDDAVQTASSHPLTTKICWRNIIVYSVGMLLAVINCFVSSKNHIIMVLYGAMLGAYIVRWSHSLRRIRRGEVIYAKTNEPASPTTTAIMATAFAMFLTVFSVVAIYASVQPSIAKLLWLIGDTVAWCAAWLAWKHAAPKRQNLQTQKIFTTAPTKDVQVPTALTSVKAVPANWWTQNAVREEVQEKTHIDLRR